MNNGETNESNILMIHIWKKLDKFLSISNQMESLYGSCRVELFYVDLNMG